MTAAAGRIGHLGPIPEGLVAWLLAGSALVGVAARDRRARAMRRLGAG